MRPPAPWAIFDVELGELDGLSRPAEAEAVVLRFRRDGVLLGKAHFTAGSFPTARAELAQAAAVAAGPAIAAMLGAGGERLAAGRAFGGEAAFRAIAEPDLMARLSRVIAERRAREITLTGTIVICTRGRPAQLSECLDAVAAETAAGRETIVVDNGPDPATEAVVAARPGVRYVAEPRPGLSRARNAGVAAASGDVVVFVDDDVRPEPGWIDALLRAFDADDIDVVCGLVLPDTLDTEAQIAFEHDLGFGGMGFLPLIFDDRYRSVHKWSVQIAEVGAGANMAVRRRRVVELGGFDVRIGPGAAGGCGDDSEYWHRVLFAGGRLAYEPFSIVRHQHRRDIESLRRQAVGYGCGAVVALFAQFARDKDPRDLLHAFVFFPLWFAWRAAAAPWRWGFGSPDRLLGCWIRGYLRALPYARYLLGGPEAGLERAGPP